MLDSILKEAPSAFLLSLYTTGLSPIQVDPTKALKARSAVRVHDLCIAELKVFSGSVEG